MMIRNAECVFCRIVAAELPSSVVYEDESLIAFLDTSPLAEGHLLVLPRDHYAALTDMPPDLCGRICSALPAIARSVVAVTGAEGFNLLQSNGSVAGQVVNHVHFHLIPRATADGLGFRWKTNTYAAGRAQQLASEIQRALAHPGA